MKNNSREVITETTEETQKLGEDLAKTLRGGEILALYGDLGSGKTTFVQGLAKGLGIMRQINSPTFLLIKQYRIKNQESGIKELFHIDLYRVEKIDELKNLGLSDIFNNKEAVVAIEWAEKLGELLPEKRIAIQFDYLDNKRRIVISR